LRTKDAKLSLWTGFLHERTVAEQESSVQKPVDVSVEFITAGAFDWVFADGHGKEVRTLHHKNPHGGWTSMNFPSLGLFGDYSIGFRNASLGKNK
jgi:hypothetical protein